MTETQVDMLVKPSTVHKRLEEWKGRLQAVELHEGPRDDRSSPRSQAVQSGSGEREQYICIWLRIE
jgi:hypothetical protein